MYSLIKQSLFSASWQTQLHDCPQALLPWLTESQSLSKKLLAYSQSFRVNLLHADWGPVYGFEKQVMVSQKNFIREVELMINDQTWIYARSIFSQSLIDRTGSDLVSLANKPLGDYLFNQPDLKRSPLHFSQLHLPQQTLSARHSQFYFANDAVLVTEVFLPVMLQSLR